MSNRVPQLDRVAHRNKLLLVELPFGHQPLDQRRRPIAVRQRACRLELPLRSSLESSSGQQNSSGDVATFEQRFRVRDLCGDALRVGDGRRITVDEHDLEVPSRV